MKRFITMIAIVFCTCIAPLKGQPPHEKPTPLSEGERKWVETTLQGLSLEEKVGQMLQVRCYADYSSFESAGYKSLKDELQEYHIGSVVLATHITREGLVRVSPMDAAKVINQVQTDSKLPLLVAADLERGVASRLKDVPDLPWPMAFGAGDSESDVEHFGAITARAARAVGIQWALAPVADVNSNPANPVINDRSFGDDPVRVGALVAAFIRGAHENGLLVTAKHFPGYGNASIDSHSAVALIDSDLDHLHKIEFPPFMKAIETGVDAILLVHARVPALESDPEKITTLSSKIVTDVLKGQLGFKRVATVSEFLTVGFSHPRYDSGRWT